MREIYEVSGPVMTPSSRAQCILEAIEDRPNDVRTRRLLLPMSDPDPSFFERVWDVVAQIPPGRVTTYGDIAAHLGRRGAARTVGWALNEAVGTDLPCHRVVNRNGVLTGKRHFETPCVMKERLRSEGVTFVAEDRVALDEHRWTPGGTEA